ncbi:MAG: hypothetical protein Q9187_003376, partial [Circinaria calcarea]
MAREVVDLISIGVFSLLFETIGKLSALHSIATHQAFPEALLSEAWEEFGRLRVLGNNLVQGNLQDLQDLPSGSVVETLRLSLRDLDNFLDYGIRSFCTRSTPSVAIDQGDVSDGADISQPSPEEVLHDISEVITDLYKLNMVVAAYGEEIEDVDDFSIADSIEDQDRLVESSVMASPRSVGSAIDVDRPRPVPIPMSRTYIREPQLSELIVRTPTRLLPSAMISKSTQTSSEILRTSQEPDISINNSARSVQNPEEHPTFNSVPDRRTNKQRHSAAARLISWVYDHGSLSPNSTLRNSNTNVLAGREALLVAEGTQDIKHLRSIFKALDQGGNDFLTKGRLHTALTNPDDTLFDPHTAKLLMHTFDTDNKGSLNFRQFQALWGFLRAWRSIFDRFDEGNKGTLTYDDYELAVKGFF